MRVAIHRSSPQKRQTCHSSRCLFPWRSISIRISVRVMCKPRRQVSNFMAWPQLPASAERRSGVSPGCLRSGRASIPRPSGARLAGQVLAAGFQQMSGHGALHALRLYVGVHLRVSCCFPSDAWQFTGCQERNQRSPIWHGQIIELRASNARGNLCRQNPAD